MREGFRLLQKRQNEATLFPHHIPMHIMHGRNIQFIHKAKKLSEHFVSNRILVKIMHGRNIQFIPKTTK